MVSHASLPLAPVSLAMARAKIAGSPVLSCGRARQAALAWEIP